MGLLSKAISITIVAQRSGSLLNKMTMYTKDLTGTIVAQPRSRESKRRGLLKRSLVFLGLEADEEQEGASLIIVDYTENIQKFLNQIGRFESDFSFFSGLFSFFIQELNIARGALFLFSRADKAFVPWLHIGLDQELCSSLVLSEGRLESLKPGRIKNAQTLFPGATHALQKPLFMFPFQAQDRLVGSLLVSGLCLDPQSEASLFELFENISWKIGDTISSVMSGLNRFADPPFNFASAQEAITQLVGTKNGNADSFYIITLPFSPLVQAVRERHRYIDSWRLRTVILFMFNSFLALLGAAVPRHSDDIVLVVRASRLYSPKLLVHHLVGLVKDVFKGLAENVGRLEPAKIFEYPQCGKNPQEIIAEL